jgi:hypothetical protein
MFIYKEAVGFWITQTSNASERGTSVIRDLWTPAGITNGGHISNLPLAGNFILFNHKYLLSPSGLGKRNLTGLSVEMCSMLSCSSARV